MSCFLLISMFFVSFFPDQTLSSLGTSTHIGSELAKDVPSDQMTNEESLLLFVPVGSNASQADKNRFFETVEKFNQEQASTQANVPNRNTKINRISLVSAKQFTFTFWSKVINMTKTLTQYWFDYPSVLIPIVIIGMILVVIFVPGHTSMILVIIFLPVVFCCVIWILVKIKALTIIFVPLLNLIASFFFVIAFPFYCLFDFYRWISDKEKKTSLASNEVAIDITADWMLEQIFSQEIMKSVKEIDITSFQKNFRLFYRFIKQCSHRAYLSVITAQSMEKHVDSNKQQMKDYQSFFKEELKSLSFSNKDSIIMKKLTQNVTSMDISSAILVIEQHSVFLKGNLTEEQLNILKRIIDVCVLCMNRLLPLEEETTTNVAGRINQVDQAIDFSLDALLSAA